MNEKFYDLSTEKQERILNAGYKVFSENSYEKSPVGEIAREAGISKSLLFYYFRNKKELYLYLWDQAVKCSERLIDTEELFRDKDYFDILELSVRRKIELIQEYPYLCAFSLKAYCEKHPDVVCEIQQRKESLLKKYNKPILAAADPERFIPGLDLQMMYQEMYWASDGYIRSMLQGEEFHAREAAEGFHRLIAFWKSIYLRRS